MFHIRFVLIPWSKPWPHLLYVVVVFCHIAKKTCTSRQIGSFRSFPQGQGMKSNKPRLKKNITCDSFPGFLPEANWSKLLSGFRPVRCLRSWRSNCGARGMGQRSTRDWNWLKMSNLSSCAVDNLRQVLYVRYFLRALIKKISELERMPTQTSLWGGVTWCHYNLAREMDPDLCLHLNGPSRSTGNHQINQHIE